MFKELLSQINNARKTDFFRNVMTLLTGTALGQIIALLLSPILTRLFSLQDFTTLEQYMFILSILMVIVAGRYEFAVMQPDSRDDARTLTALCIRIVFFVSAFFLVLFLFAGEAIAEYYHNPDLAKWLWTLPIALFAAGVFNVINYWFSRHGNYKVAATSKFLYSAAGEPIKVSMGRLSPNSGGLITGTIIAHWVSAIYAWSRFKLSEPRTIFHVSKQRMKELAVTFKAYPVYTIWGSLLNNLAQWAHVGVFGYYYGEKALIPIAFIALSRRIFFNPLGMLATSYGQVFYQRITVIKDPKELRSFFLKNLFRFLIFASVMVLVIQLIPDNTLGFIFGEQWTDAMVYLRILSYWYALNFVLSSLSFIFNRLHLQWYTLVSDIVHFVVVVGGFAWSYYSGQSEMEAVQTMVIVKVAYLILNGAAVIYFLSRNIRTTTGGH